MPDQPPLAQEDAQPCDNSYPTTWWSPGEIIEENHSITIPLNMPPGPYVVTTGIYDLATGMRLPMQALERPTEDQTGLGPVSGDYFVLGKVAVVP
jgi:hypothetical protein